MTQISVKNQLRWQISSVHGSRIDKIHIEAVHKKKRSFKYEVCDQTLHTCMKFAYCFYDKKFVEHGIIHLMLVVFVRKKTDRRTLKKDNCNHIFQLESYEKAHEGQKSYKCLQCHAKLLTQRRLEMTYWPNVYKLLICLFIMGNSWKSQFIPSSRREQRWSK